MILEAAEKALQDKEDAEAEISEVGLADEVPTKFWSVYTAGTEKDKSSDAAVREEFQRLQHAEEERRGDVRGGAARYQFMSFGGPGLRFSRVVRNALAKLHGVLGHVSNEKMARMLALEGANREVLEACKALRCEICSRLAPPQADPKVSAQQPRTFNKQTLHDTFFIFGTPTTRSTLLSMSCAASALTTQVC